MSNNTGVLQFGIVNDNGISAKTEHMRIESGGNVGIGEDNPGLKLHVHAASSSDIVKFQNDNGSFILGQTSNLTSLDLPSSGDSFRIRQGSHISAYFRSGGDVGIGTAYPASASGWNRVLHVYAGNNSGALLRLSDNASGSSGDVGLMIGQWNEDSYIINRDEGDIRFYRGSTEHMRIDDYGNILTSNSSGMAASQNASGASGNVSIRGRTNYNSVGVLRLRKDGDSGNMLDVYSSTSLVGSISQNGSTTSFNTSSDYRLKENIVAMSGATERLKQLRPSRFNFIADADTSVDGFLAHEVQDVVPEAITGSKDAVDADGNPEYQGIDQSKLVPLLVATIQELEARIAALES